MNNILNIKINSNLSKIIGIYLLPLVSNKTNYLTELKSRTINICDNLNNNEHFDNKFGGYLNGLQNTRIKKRNSFVYLYYWTIRKIDER